MCSEIGNREERAPIFSSFPHMALDEMYQAMEEVKERGDLRLVGMISIGVYCFVDTKTKEVYLVDKWMYEEFK